MSSGSWGWREDPEYDKLIIEYLLTPDQITFLVVQSKAT